MSHALLLASAVSQLVKSTGGNAGGLFGLSAVWTAVLSIAVSTVFSGSVVGAFFTFRPQRSKLVAEASEIAVETMRTVLDSAVDMLRSELDAARQEVDRLKDREAQLLKRIDALEQHAREEADELRAELAQAHRDLAAARQRLSELESCEGCPLRQNP